MTESPKYAVIKKQKEIEIRQYSGYIQAEVVVVANDFKSAIDKGFKVLAGYIFGNNISRQKIEMNTPVHAYQSQKIAMTTPVTVTGNDSCKVAFVMPSEYTLETLPSPKITASIFRPSQPIKWQRSGFPVISSRKISVKIKSALDYGWRNKDWKRKVILLLPVTIHLGYPVLSREMKS